MTDELQQLSILLGKYQADLLELNKKQTEALRIGKENKINYWNIDFVNGVKAQFNHARIIKNRIDIQISNQITISNYYSYKEEYVKKS